MLSFEQNLQLSADDECSGIKVVGFWVVDSKLSNVQLFFSQAKEASEFRTNARLHKVPMWGLMNVFQILDLTICDVMKT